MGFINNFLSELTMQEYKGKTLDSDQAYDLWLDTYKYHGLSYTKWKKSYNIKVVKTKQEKYMQKINRLNKTFSFQNNEIQRLWSIMYEAKQFNGSIAEEFEKLCKNNIKLCLQMNKIDKEYDHDPIEFSQGYRRLCMLYEKQHKYNDLIDLCNEAISNGFNVEDCTKRKARAEKRLK